MSMSLSDPISEATPANDPYAWIDRFAADLHFAARDLVRDGEAARVSDEAVARIMTAADAAEDGEDRGR